MIAGAALLLFVLLPATVCAALPVGLADGQPLPSLAPMLERVSPAVVNISTRTRLRREHHPLLRDPLFRHFFDIPPYAEQEDNSLGSGVILDADRGYVITNHHVIHRANEINITLQDGRRLAAKLLGSDPETDIALLQIPAEGLSAIEIGDSEKLRVGDFVVAIGNPFGLRHTVTSGIVSALGRTGLGIEGYENFIQTDASINPGNSGGPLVNLRGELVGLNTAILAPNGGNIGISFAIPVHMARAIVDQILEHGGVRRGSFGIQAQDLNPELARALDLEGRKGALLLRVEPGSPADRAGLLDGDLIESINGKPVRSAADLRNQVGLMRVGERLSLGLVRGGEARSVELRIGDPMMGFLHGEHIHPYLGGALLKDSPEESAPGSLAGVLVGHVDYASEAWRLGLRKGDLILQLNRTRCRNVRQLSLAARQAEDILLLEVRRGDRVVRLIAR